MLFRVQIMKGCRVFLLFNLTWVFLNFCVYCQKPSSVNIGVIFTFNSVIGRVAKVAIKEAVSDVNANPKILKSTALNLLMRDADASVFLGSVEGTSLFFTFEWARQFLSATLISFFFFLIVLFSKFCCCLPIAVM